MSHGYFFGYGSLVNRDTHDYAQTRRARLSGWRRKWQHTCLRPVAYLTVVPDPATEIDGLIAAVPPGGWEALDERERAYDRLHAGDRVRHDLPEPAAIAVYAIPEDRHGAPGEVGRVLLSYIDVVVQGYLREFGEAGVRRFFETTEGWEASVLDDRAEPVYPRHRKLSADERLLVDDHLRELGVRTQRL